MRIYGMPGAILKHLNVMKLRLLSNNPEKIQALEKAGIDVVERVPCIVEPIASTEVYLRTKKEKMGHLLGEM
jgi:GTP cyclohydrolase II